MEDDSRLEELRRRVAEEPQSRAFVLLAEEYRQRGSLAEAEETLRAGLTGQPEYLAARVALGRCELERGHCAGAIATLQAVVEADRTQMVAYKLLINAHLENAAVEAAAAALESYRSLNPQDPEIADIDQLLRATRAAEAGGAEPAGDSGPEEEEPRVRPVTCAPGRHGPDGAVFRSLASPLTRLRLAGLRPRILLRPSASATALRGPAPREATATLARLYLQQGHVLEAENIFAGLLEQDAGNAEALAGLESVVRARKEAVPAAALREPDPTAGAGDMARDRPIDGPPPVADAPQARRVRMLRSYVDRLASLRESRDAPA